MERRNHRDRDDEYLYNAVRRSRGHPLALRESSTTLPKLMYDVALYKDDQRRIYSPRIEATEEFNGRPTNVDESEKLVCLDCYIAPRITEAKLDHLRHVTTREQRLENSFKKKELVGKGAIPAVGERIVFRIRNEPTVHDRETVREWSGIVVDVNWGQVVILQEDDTEKVILNENCGFVKIRVLGYYPRSLVVNPAETIRRGRMDLPA